jgi:hypothetical protein
VDALPLEVFFDRAYPDSHFALTAITTVRFSLRKPHDGDKRQ